MVKYKIIADNLFAWHYQFHTDERGYYEIKA